MFKVTIRFDPENQWTWVSIDDSTLEISAWGDDVPHALSWLYRHIADAIHQYTNGLNSYDLHPFGGPYASDLSILMKRLQSTLEQLKPYESLRFTHRL